MDGETSYESDISESWSLIDINLNEESVSVTEACSELEKSSQSDLTTGKLKVENEKELEDFVRQCKEINKTDFSRISDSDSDASSKNQGLPIYTGTKVIELDPPSGRSSDNDGLHDSGDSESIEILELHSNYTDSEIEKLDIGVSEYLDFPTYHSDEGESSEGKVDKESRSFNSNSTVIKRRRKRVSRSSEDAVNSVNSEKMSSAENNSTSSSRDTKKENPDLSEQTNEAEGHPVYRHYRNNVANTILSLSVGVIFAGVACIAVGHFLGVQDAAETAVELVETLKKLQVENAALQSRLSHLNRALLTREMNSKLELPLNQPLDKAATPCADPSKSQQTDLNSAALSEIRSSLNSIEWLSKLQNLVQKNNKVTETEHGGIDFNGFGKFIHDQLHTLNARHEEGAKVLEVTDRKISKVLHKIISRLSTSQDHIEKLYAKLIKLKNKLNHKMKKVFRESSKDIQFGRSTVKRGVPVREVDLQSINWNNEIKELPDQVNPDSVSLYNFPQPKNYYKKEISEEELERTNSTSIVKGKYSDNKNKKKRKNEKKEEKKHTRDNWKKKKPKEKETKEKKGEKRRKRAANKGGLGPKNKIGVDEPKQNKLTPDQNVFNETLFQNKMHPKVDDKDVTSKLRFKKVKNCKPKKVLFSKPRRRSHLKKKHLSQVYPGSGCFNLTGHWVFKWAGGREEIRRHQTLGDWQFERAKVRKELRDDIYNENWQFERAKIRKELRDDIYNENWQFERAKARKELREDDFNGNWQFKRAGARESNRNEPRWHRGKYAKYVGKDFFQEGFSWI